MIIKQIEVTGVKDIESRLGELKSKSPQVVSRAINRAAINARKNIAKETTARYYIKSEDVKETMSTVKSSKSRLQAAVISKGQRIALSKFKVNPGTPVQYRGKSSSPKVYKAGVEKAGGLKPLNGDPKAFVAIISSNGNEYKGVFARTSKHNYPIEQLYGPAVPQMIKNEKIMKVVSDDVNRTLQKRIDAEINNVLRKG